MGTGHGTVAGLGVNPAAWRGRRVLLTGHTGFKGSWLALWLRALGAEVVGYALPPEGERSLYELARVDDALTSIEADVRDAERLALVLEEHQPEVVLHLAAQALVRASYRAPLETYATNVMGTANLLEAVRRSAAPPRAVVIVTSDKCYLNRETERPYREDDAMGGADPYSSSKGCAELVVAAYRQSYFPPERHASHGVTIASARAGNVIGGGDWATDRLVVDLVSAYLRGERPRIRNPRAVRPWQFVLEPLAGYVQLAEFALTDPERAAGGWNFGPPLEDCRPVSWLVERLASAWGDGAGWDLDEGEQPHEAQLLLLDADKARRELGWRPRYALDEAIDETVAWYRALQRGEDIAAFTGHQIERYWSQAVPA